MKFAASAVLAMGAVGVSAFQPISTSPSLAATSARSTELYSSQLSSMSKKKEERLNFMRSDQFHRRGFKEVRKDVEDAMEEQYQSDLVQEMRSSNFVVQKDGVKVFLAKVGQTKSSRVTLRYVT